MEMETKSGLRSPTIDESPRASPIDMTTKSSDQASEEEFVSKIRKTENTTDFEMSSPENNFADDKDLTEPEDVLTQSMLEIVKSPETLHTPTSFSSCTKVDVTVSSEQNSLERGFQLKQNFMSSGPRTSTTTSSLESTMLAQRYNQCLFNNFFAKQPQQAFCNTVANPLNTFAAFRTPVPVDLFGFPRPIARSSSNGLGGFVNPIPLEQEVSQLKLCLQRINKEIQDIDDSSEGNLEASKTQLKSKLTSILEFSQSASAAPIFYPPSMLSQQQALIQTVSIKQFTSCLIGIELLSRKM